MRRIALLVVIVAGLVAGGCGGSSAGGAGAGGRGGTTASGEAGGTGTGGAGGSHTDAGVDALATCGASTSASSGLPCNTIEANGPCVTETIGSGTPPAPAGGTVVAGTYDLMKSTAYPNADAGADAAVTLDESPRRQTSVVGGSGSPLTFESTATAGAEVQRLNGTLTFSGSSLTLTPTCPVYDAGGNDPPGTVPYTATTAGTQTTIITYNTAVFDHLRLDEYLKR